MPLEIEGLLQKILWNKIILHSHQYWTWVFVENNVSYHQYPWGLQLLKTTLKCSSLNVDVMAFARDFSFFSVCGS